MQAEKAKNIGSFFTSTHNPYYVFAPDYLQGSAGVRALHHLCHALNESGQEAYIPSGVKTNPKLRTPWLSAEKIRDHFLSGKKPISIYPETINNNIFGTPHKTHWLLNVPGHVGGNKSLQGERVFYFLPWMNHENLAADQLIIPLIDITIFNNENNAADADRKGTCYYAHKYFTFGHEIPEDIENGSISLCHNIKRTPSEIASILRSSKALYCFEETSLISEALLCGCPVMLIPSDYMKKEEHWINQGMPRGAGWADEPDVLQRIRQQVIHFKDDYENYHSRCWETVDGFIAKTHQEFTLDNDIPDISAKKSEVETFWDLPIAMRASHLDGFLASVSRLPAFSHFEQSSPVQHLAHWLDRTVEATSRIIPPHEAPAPAPTPITPPPVQPFSPKEESTLLTEITSLMAAGQSDKATTLLARLVAHDTLRWEVYDTLGQLYVEQNKLDEAAPVLLKGAALEFSSTHCLRKLAAVFAMQGEVWRTLAACTQILKREPDDQELHLFVRDVLVSTSPRFDDISWLAPEWTEAMDALANYKGQAQAARSLLDNLQAKARSILEEHHPLKRLGNRPLPRKRKSR